MRVVLAGVVAGIDSIGFNIALAALMFAGPLAGGVGLAASLTLLATAVIALALSAGSGLRGNIGHVQDIGVALMAPALAAIAASGTVTAETSIATAFAIIAAASLATGLLMYVTGRLGLGRMVRFFPQTVIAGFLAGTGWLLIISGIAVAANLSMDRLFDPDVWSGDRIAHIAPVIGFALVLWFLLPRIAHPAAMAILLVVGVAAFYAVLAATGHDIVQAQSAGWLAAAPPTGNLTDLFSMPQHVDWPTLVSTLPLIGIVAALSLLASLMNTSALETLLGEEADQDRELRLTGLANIACGVIAAPPGYSGLASSLIAHRISPGSRAAGAVMAAVTVLGLSAADTLVSTIPIFVTSGLIVYLGADLLRDWLVNTRRRLSPAEWAIVVVIVVAVAVAGFATGVAVGLAIAVVLFVFNYARVPILRRTQTLDRLRSTLDRDPQQTALLRETGAVVAVYELQGFLFFGTAERLRLQIKTRLADARLPRLRRLILDFGQVSGFDGAALALVERIATLTRERGIELVLSRLRPDLVGALERAAPDLMTASHVTHAETLDEAVETAEQMLLGASNQPVSPSEIAARYAVLETDGPRLAEYFASLPLERLARGTRVLVEGEPADGLVLLEEGRVTVRRKGDTAGEPLRLRAMAAGSIIGDIGFANRGLRTADVVAETEVALRRIPGENLERLERDNPSLAMAVSRAVMRALAEKVVTANRVAEHG
ncbi:MAG: SLC26A/SulP transporter family protein [Rhizobiaceae bacterium]